MKRRPNRLLAGLFLAFVPLFLAPRAAAQDSPAPEDGPEKKAVLEQMLTGEPPDTTAVQVAAEPPLSASLIRHLIPELTAPILTWLAVFVLLMLFAQSRPVIGWRNLDLLTIILAVLLLGLRGETGVIAWLGGRNVQWCVYLIYAALTVYWLLRGFLLLGNARSAVLRLNVSEAGLAILVAVGLIVAYGRIASEPYSASTRDALLGGAHLATTGHLPYGSLAFAEQSPLLYATFAGALKVAPPIGPASGDDGPAGSSWQDGERMLYDNPTPARIVHGGLLLAMLIGLLILGAKLHSQPAGLALMAAFCVLPNALECLTDPAVMLPAALLVWSLACGLMAGAGPLLATLFGVAAGVASPWAWLVLPVVLAYLLRRGWTATGAIAGLFVGLALAAVGLTLHTSPALPSNAALELAGLPPRFAATLGDQREVVLTPVEQPSTAPASLKRGLWRWLIESDKSTLVDAPELRVSAGDVPKESIRFHDVVASDAARHELNHSYAEALHGESAVVRFVAAARVVLECTWLNRAEPDSIRLPTTWGLWAEGGDSHTWLLLRRGAKIVVSVLAVFVAMLLIGAKGVSRSTLVGGVLVVLAGAQLVRAGGGALEMAWILPLLLVLLAAGDAPAPPVPAKAAGAPRPAQPRITIEP